MKGYLKLRKKAFKILKSELSDDLFYHGLHHTLDVLNVCNRYIKREKMDRYNAKLLRIGAILHDIGFTISTIDHEKKGVNIAKELMEEFGFSKADFNVVKGLILATRIPQQPKNYLEKIVCDADLDYLGRNDFYEISDLLYHELISNGTIQNKKEWDLAQITFLEAHSYHTDFALKNRQPKKEKRIAELLSSLDA